jgi:hypothetical protein
MVRATTFDGRQATWHHRSICSIPEIRSKPFAHYVLVGEALPQSAKQTPMLRLICPGTETVLETDDETEAQAAYEKGAAWVLTGEGP